MSHIVSTIRPDEKRAYRINEAAAAYRLSRSTLYKLISDGKLHSVKVAGRRLIPRDAMEALIRGGVEMNAPQMRCPAPRANAGNRAEVTRNARLPIASPALNRKAISRRFSSPGAIASPCPSPAPLSHWRAWGGGSFDQSPRLRLDQSSGAGSLPCRSE